MKVVLTRASDTQFREEREISSLEELIVILDELGQVIVNRDYDDREAFEIMDYDTYVE